MKGKLPKGGRGNSGRRRTTGQKGRKGDSAHPTNHLTLFLSRPSEKRKSQKKTQQKLQKRERVKGQPQPAKVTARGKPSPNRRQRNRRRGKIPLQQKIRPRVILPGLRRQSGRTAKEKKEKEVSTEEIPSSHDVSHVLYLPTVKKRGLRPILPKRRGPVKESGRLVRFPACAVIKKGQSKRGGSKKERLFARRSKRGKSRAGPLPEVAPTTGPRK